MKLCAVICEFNPFHNGHKYLLTKVKSELKPDAVLLVMSGNFVQRAEYAIVNKNLRTAWALKNGADIVVELPTVFATASGELFARGAIDIITQINGVTHLAFGCENDNADILYALARIQASENDIFKQELKHLLDLGEPYAKAYCRATVKAAKTVNIDSVMCDIVLSKPNNLLGIEYIKQLIKRKSGIKIVSVKRKGSDYNDEKLGNNFSSATAIRQKIYDGQLDSICGNVPKNCFEDLKSEIFSRIPDPKIFSALTVNALRYEDLEPLLDAGEGLDIRLKKNAQKYFNLDEIIAATKSKRYTQARVRRLCLQALLNIKKETPNQISSSPIRLLGIKKELQNKIGSLSKNLIIQNSDFEKLNVSKEYLDIEKKAADVYSIITQRNGDLFLGNKLIII